MEISSRVVEINKTFSYTIHLKKIESLEIYSKSDYFHIDLKDKLINCSTSFFDEVKL